MEVNAAEGGAGRLAPQPIAVIYHSVAQRAACRANEHTRTDLRIKPADFIAHGSRAGEHGVNVAAVSLDGLFVYHETSRWQPAFSNTDWANLIKYGSGAWSADRGPGEGTITPIMQLDYANGQHAGVGYMEVWVGMHKTISGAAKARETFTVSGPDRRVSSVSVRLKRVSGSSPLAVRLEKADGTLVANGSIAASAIPVGDPSVEGGSGWATLDLGQAVTLQSGQGYHLVLSSNADTDYSIFVIRKGASYRFSSQTWFSDGLAQYNSGSGWTGFDGWSGPSNEGDLQLYFN